MNKYGNGRGDSIRKDVEGGYQKSFQDRAVFDLDVMQR